MHFQFVGGSQKFGRDRFEGTKRPLIAQYAGAIVAICTTSGHARSIFIGRNKTRPLSLMSAFHVNAETSQMRCLIDQRVNRKQHAAAAASLNCFNLARTAKSGLSLWKKIRRNGGQRSNETTAILSTASIGPQSRLARLSPRSARSGSS